MTLLNESAKHTNCLRGIPSAKLKERYEDNEEVGDALDAHVHD